MTPSGIEHATFQLVAQCRTPLVIMNYSVVLIKYGQREMQHGTFTCNLCPALVIFWLYVGSQDISTGK
jgi:hypothetical protein